MQKRLLLVAAAACTLLPTAAFALADGLTSAGEICRSDMERYCPGRHGDGAGMDACLDTLHAKSASLDPQCRIVIDSMSGTER